MPSTKRQMTSAPNLALNVDTDAVRELDKLRDVLELLMDAAQVTNMDDE